jgi:uncharacterized DUF497 family protein
MWGDFPRRPVTRHRVTQTEAEQVFLNRPLVVMGDGAHSEAEARHFAFGRTDVRRLMTIVFTVRGALIRVISARPMSRSERSEYAKTSDT